MTSEQIKQAARTIVFDSRDAEWQKLNRVADTAAEAGDYVEAEDALCAMTTRFEANVAERLAKIDAEYQEAVGAEVTLFLMRLVEVVH